MRRRICSLLLAGLMALSSLGTAAFAEGGVLQNGGIAIGASGLCEHHTEHTADCGYTVASRSSPAIMNTPTIAMLLWSSAFMLPMMRVVAAWKTRPLAIISAARKAAVSSRRWTAGTSMTKAVAMSRLWKVHPVILSAKFAAGRKSG